jgi:cation:H+ antiporter
MSEQKTQFDYQCPLGVPLSEYLVPSFQVAVGLIGLIVGGELLVRGASALAAAARISPLVIGLTVVAFGTSAPEQAVALNAAMSGNADVALGNAVGSNILNVLFILGLSALILPLIVSSTLIRRDVPIMIGTAVLLLLLGLDGNLGFIDGAVLFGSLIAYIVWTVVESRRESAAVKEEFGEGTRTSNKTGAKYILLQIAILVAGLLVLAVASHYLVKGSVKVARLMGVTELMIGLTIVAVGTSLPEAVTSLVASMRGQRDIAVGNVVGSNIFNVLAVLGLAGLFAPDGVTVSPAVLRFDIPVMIAVSVACLPIFFTGQRIARWEGALFLGYYIAYTAYLIMNATGNEHRDEFATVMLFFVVPLTVVTIIVSVFRTFRERNGAIAESPES